MDAREGFAFPFGRLPAFDGTGRAGLENPPFITSVVDQQALVSKSFEAYMVV
jgi:hypothetical protein